MHYKFYPIIINVKIIKYKWSEKRGKKTEGLELGAVD